MNLFLEHEHFKAYNFLSPAGPAYSNLVSLFIPRYEKSPFHTRFFVIFRRGSEKPPLTHLKQGVKKAFFIPEVGKIPTSPKLFRLKQIGNIVNYKI